MEIFDSTAATTEELEDRLGARIRAVRLSRNLEQAAVAERAGVSVRTIKNLEAGHGSSTATLVRVVRALGRLDWIDSLAPAVSVSPLRLLAQERKQSAPQRASRPRGPVSGSGTTGSPEGTR